MARYCFRDEETQEVHTLDFPFGQAPREVVLDNGHRAHRDYSQEGASGKLPSPRTWPRTSTSLGVHPDQVASERERLARLGVPTDFTDDGDMILTSAKHRREACRACGL